MLTVEEIRERLMSRNLSYVARKTGLSVITVWKLRSGKGKSFAYNTVKILSDFLESEA